MGTTSTITLTGPAKDVDLIVWMLAEEAKRKHSRGYPNVGWNMEDTEPPSGNYFTRDSVLQVSIYPVTTTSTIVVSYKILLPNGKVTLGSSSFTVFTQVTRNNFQIPLDEGFLLSLSVTITNSGFVIQRGDTFVQIGVSSNLPTTSPVFRMLLSDYVTTNASIGWPDGNLRSNTDGTGFLFATQVGSPGAGVDWAYTLPTWCRMWLHSGTATLTTSATVANRIPILTLVSSSALTFWQVGPLAQQTAGKTVVYNFTECATLSTDAAGNAVVPLPTEMFLLPSTIIKMVTSGIQTTDQWSNIILNYETWYQL